jgi:hypothetical protein
MADRNLFAVAAGNGGRGEILRWRYRLLAGLVGLGVLMGCAPGQSKEGRTYAWDHAERTAVTLSQAERENFCAAVAREESGEPFDTPTRARMYAAHYQQCLTLYTGTIAG